MVEPATTSDLDDVARCSVPRYSSSTIKFYEVIGIFYFVHSLDFIEFNVQEERVHVRRVLRVLEWPIVGLEEALVPRELRHAVKQVGDRLRSPDL